MTAELVRGQNHPLPGTRLEIRVSAGTPVVAAATLGDEQGRVRAVEQVAHPGSPTLPGLEVSRQAAADHRLAVDLEALDEGVHRVNVLLALPFGTPGPSRFAAVAAPFVAVTGLDGTEIASFTLTGLGVESAVVAVELYRRQGAWKIRAIGQGYEGGLAALLADQGLAEAGQVAAAIQEAVTLGVSRSVSAPPPRTSDDTRVRTPGPGATGAPGGPAPADPEPPAAVPQQAVGDGGPINYAHPRRQTSTPPPPAPVAPPAAPGEPARPVAGDASGWSMDERLYNQVWGMFEDLARAVAAYRSAVDFADSRLEQELDRALSDPRDRLGSSGDRAREEARVKREELVDRAREALDRDLAQLTAESEVVEPALPPAYARWDNPVWHGYRVPMELPMALRIGDLHLPEQPQLRIPMLIRLPLERGLWIDSGRSGFEAAAFLDPDQAKGLAVDTAVAVAARLLAVYPAHEFTLHVIDPAGAAAARLAPLTRSGVLAAPPAAGAAGVSEVLARLTERVDLVQMAVRAGAGVDALPPGMDTAEQLLIVNDFPHGFDDRALNQLRYLADEGPSVGVHLLMIADREEASEYGPVLQPLWRSLLRLTPAPDDHLADPWVGHAWTYEPPLAPSGSRVLEQVLGQVGEARAAWPR
ncbi:General stress protein 16U [Streptomyces hundungensis]|uniref:General stress protein 16U n=1 Tax=Streptomyces hundungensis TaxID=1077946 RepID=A0A387HQK7_9ACTN|nr:TerD family protein [Streptomyces hundungensis]AYG83582.1 General stress protein 16U [Streptomyces hundungensis]